jgi:hypothetical protein
MLGCVVLGSRESSRGLSLVGGQECGHNTFDMLSVQIREAESDSEHQYDRSRGADIGVRGIIQLCRSASCREGLGRVS